jgi:endonuclease/exonuclease/phosphatase family metal-dependent hydrolase
MPLRVLHWNIHSWKDAAGAPNQDAIAALLKQEAPDVVSLTEVNEPWGAPRTLAEIADECGYTWIFVPSIELGTDPGARGYGNALLTKVPVTAVQQLPVHQDERGYHGTEPSETRSVILARLAGSGLWVGSTHFPATHHASRKAAARKLRQLTLQLTTPWLICGDFNAPAKLFGDFSDIRVHPERPPATFPAHRPRTAIDYILASPGVRTTTEVLPAPGSDHLPLLAEVSMGAALSELVVAGVADGSGAVGGPGLGEDPVDVGFHGVGAEVQLSGDVGVGLAPGDHGQDLGFPLGQPVGQLAGELAHRRPAPPGGRGLEQGDPDGGIHDGKTGDGTAQRLGDVGLAGVLSEVTACTSLEGVDDRGVIRISGEDNNGDLWVMSAELAGGFDSVKDRHPQIEQDRVRADLPDDVQGFLPVGRRADDLDPVGQAEQHDQSVAHGGLVVSDDHPQRH